MSKISGFDDLSIGQLKALVQKLGGTDMVIDALRDDVSMTRVPTMSRLSQEAEFRFGVEWVPSVGHFLERPDVYTEKEQNFGARFAYHELFQSTVRLAIYELTSPRGHGFSQEIYKGLPMKFFFKANVAFQVIAAMVHRQPEGVPGELTTARGASNVFYVLDKNDEIATVSIYWREQDQKWILQYFYHDVGYNKDSRIFVPS